MCAFRERRDEAGGCPSLTLAGFPRAACFSEIPSEVGLSEIELPFYNIILTEVAGNDGEQVVEQPTLDAIRSTTKALVQKFDEASTIVDLFNKPDQIKTLKKEIKRTVIEQPFGNAKVVKSLQERFIELARTKFDGNH